MAFDFAAWVRQPTTIHGIAGLVGVAAGAVAGVLTHQLGISAAVGGVVWSAVAIVMPDNSAAAKPVQTFAEDLVTAIVQRRVAAAVPTLAADALAAVQAVTAQPPAPAPVTASPAPPAA